MTPAPFAKRRAGAPCALALGTMNFGKRTPADESERIVKRALERGIRVFDTANVYNGGESERILGKALGREREKVAVSSKVGLDRVGGKVEGLGGAAIRRAIDASLERLGTGVVDVYYLHAPDHATDIGETLDAIETLVHRGAVRAWGVSNYASWQILEMSDLARERGLRPPVASQVIYNLLHREIEIEHVAFARHAGLHATIFNPLAGGLLTGKHAGRETAEKGSRFDQNAMYQRRYWTRAMFDRVERLRGLATEAGITLVELAYAWAASRTGVDSILVGPATVEQLDQAIDACARALPEGVAEKVDELWREWTGTDTHYTR
jgi:aryl-alcohol dehydrogenase-like predicted oxidoreductase